MNKINATCNQSIVYMTCSLTTYTSFSKKAINNYKTRPELY
jgi:hypothetical protein